jgi:hypothetical protein
MEHLVIVMSFEGNIPVKYQLLLNFRETGWNRQNAFLKT